MSGVYEAKQALVDYARKADSERKQRLKPVKIVALAGGAGLIASRVIAGATRRRCGGRVMGLVLAARIAVTYGPQLYRAFRAARAAYRAAAARKHTMSVARPARPAADVRVLTGADSAPAT